MQQALPILSASQFEKCPKHPTNDIVLFCLCFECKEPLCKDCCKLHVHFHNNQGTQADLDTVDNVRANLLNEVHTKKIRYEEERAILHHFNDSEHSEMVKQTQAKIQKVKQTLLNAVNEYCNQLENQIKQKIMQHKQSHPGEKKDLHNKLNSIINQLDQQEKMLQQPKYIRGCLLVMGEEQIQDFDQLAFEVDNALKNYLQNAFDVFVYDDKLSKIQFAFTEYVEIREANLREELDLYTRKIRENRHYQGDVGTKTLNNFSQKQPQIQPTVQQRQMYSIYDEKFMGSQYYGQSQMKQFGESKYKADKISNFMH